jgi:hypothetical protein
VAEVLLYGDRAFSAGEVTATEAYLKARWATP